MNTNRLNAGWLMLLALSTINSQLSTAFAQGSLTPPGAPAPTMKSLDQVEARTIVNAANTPGDANNLFIITNSGSYYLTTNLVGVSGKSGISITANDVTLDLNGFALLGVSVDTMKLVELLFRALEPTSQCGTARSAAGDKLAWLPYTSSINCPCFRLISLLST